MEQESRPGRGGFLRKAGRKAPSVSVVKSRISEMLEGFPYDVVVTDWEGDTYRFDGTTCHWCNRPFIMKLHTPQAGEAVIARWHPVDPAKAALFSAGRLTTFRRCGKYSPGTSRQVLSRAGVIRSPGDGTRETFQTVKEKRFMSRVFNFSAGPAAIPQEVLEQAQAEMLDWHGSGMSVMEMSHRGKEFVSIAEKAEADLRELMEIPPTYKVLFLQGGASIQFAMIPMNLLSGKKKADYINTGSWSKKAIAEAKRFCEVGIAATSEAESFTRAPTQEELNLDPEAAYVHYTPNETIGGVEFPYVPETGSVPLVADMSSTILSRPIDVSRFGMIYAGAQKNIGPAGLAVVVIREDLIGLAPEGTAAMFDYKTHAGSGSMYNTPPTYPWYIAGLVFDWLKGKGGLAAMARINGGKAKKLYEAVDRSDFYANPVEPASRSWMNVPFTLANSDLDAAFLSEAAEQGLVTLKGHRSVGGMRASIYNAMPEAGVDALIGFMAGFEKRNG